MHTHPSARHHTSTVVCSPRAELTSKRRERVRADTKVQELRSDLRRGLSRLAGPFPMEVNAELNAGREEVAFQAALTHMQTVSTQALHLPSKPHTHSVIIPHCDTSQADTGLL